jgi:hypothetical protein
MWSLIYSQLSLRFLDKDHRHQNKNDDQKSRNLLALFSGKLGPWHHQLARPDVPKANWITMILK